MNILSTSDAGTYTCQVGLSTTSQVLGADQFVLGANQFVLGVEGRGVHMYCTNIQYIHS